MPVNFDQLPKTSFDELLGVIKENGLDEKKWKELDDFKFIEIVGKAFDWELNILKEASSSAEPGKPQVDMTPSRKIFGQEFDEVNRTGTSVFAFKWILANDYDKWIKKQRAGIVLKKEQFEDLRTLFIQISGTDHKLLALLVSIVDNDLGKAKDQWPADVQDENHDRLIFNAAKRDMIPSLTALREISEEAARLVVTGMDIGRELNIAQLAQGENVPGSLKPLTQLTGENQALDLKFLELFLDLAGAAGHMSCQGSLSVTTYVCRNFLYIQPILGEVMDGKKSCQTAYDEVLQWRADLFAASGFRKMDVNDPKDRALARMMMMMRVEDVAGARIIEDGFNGLGKREQEWLVEGMRADGLTKKAILPYYGPACFLNALGNAPDRDDGKAVAVRAVMEIFAKMYHEYGHKDGDKPCVVEIEVQSVAKRIREEDFKADPTVLREFEVPKPPTN